MRKMRLILTVLAIIISETIVSAQTIIYAKGGILINSANRRFYVDNKLQSNDNANASYTFHAGVIFEISIGDNFFFVPEFQLVQKSSASGPISLQKDTDFYLEANALFSYAPLKWLSVHVGPGLGTHIYSYHDLGSRRLFDACGNLGFAFNVSSKVQLMARGSHSIFSVTDPEIFFDPQITTGENFEYHVYNRNVQLSIAYKLGQK